MVFSPFCSKVAIAEQFFQQHNTWYEPIPKNPQLYSNSDEIIEWISSSQWKSVWVYKTGSKWGSTSPIFRGVGSEKPITIGWTSDRGNKDRAIEAGWDIIPIPVGSVPGNNYEYCTNDWPGSNHYRDARMTVVSADKNTSWDVAILTHCNIAQTKEANKNDPTDGVWKAIHLRKCDLTGDGINYPYDNMGGPSVTKSCFLTNVVTKDEIQNGLIEHALSWVGNGRTLQDVKPVYPIGVRGGGHSDDPNAPILGMRFQLNPALDCKNWDADTSRGNLNKDEQTVCVALQTYGMIYYENGGGIGAIRFEDDQNQPWNWNDFSDLGLLHKKIKYKSGTKYLWRAVKPVLPGCMDGKDNDGDGFTDFEGGDPQCYSVNDWSEKPECSDGLNNDEDHLIDYPTDPGCSSAKDDDESGDQNPPAAPRKLAIQ